MTGLLEDLETKRTPEFEELKSMHLAKELGMNTNAILTIIGIDKNKAPYDTIMNLVKGNTKRRIWVESLDTNISVHVIDEKANDVQEDEKVQNIEMTDNVEEIGKTIVSTETMEKLRKLTIDKKEAEAKAEEGLNDVV
ncbi:MAG: hypothetical protein AB9915_03625 [Candidatus Dojkabacteria bacterium]